MRMVFTQHLADDTGALAVRAVVAYTHVIHGIENAPVYRFQPVTYIREGTRHDDTHRIVEVRALHFVFYIYRSDFA